MGYLRSFPHLATFVTCGARNDDALREIAEKSGNAAQIAMCAERFEPAAFLLTPAACYHVYPMFAGQRIESSLMLTTRCQCFRREEYYQPLQRQWCFDMREVVCIGDSRSVDEFVDEWLVRMERLVAELGLVATRQVATDPFFDPMRDPKALAQLVEPVKTELCIPNGLAIGSGNRHRAFFGECYDIRYSDTHAHSACVAFGIERWLFAMADVHGPDAAAWPVPGEIG